MRRIMTAVAVLTAVVAVGVILLWVGQRRLLYFPSQVVPASPPDGVTEVTLSTDDGLELAAWFVPSDDAARPDGPSQQGATVDESDRDGGDAVDTDAEAADGVVIMFHGNGGNRVGRLPLGRSLAAQGHAVLLVDYRGYGGNPGKPSAAGLALDARAARNWVMQQSGVDDDRIVYFGESLGAAVAIELAVDHPPAAMVLRSPFTSLADVARTHYPIVPSVMLRDRWPSLDRIRELDVPILVVAGSDDRIVPTEQSERIATAAGGPSELLVIDGAGHNDLALLDGEAVLTAIDHFLATHR